MNGIASFLESPTMLLVVVLAKATLLISVGALISQLWLRPRASAALRHLVWTIVVVSLLLLPLGIWAVPGWRIAVATLPARSTATPAFAVRPSHDGGETTEIIAPAGSNTRPLQVATALPAREATARSAVHVTDLLAAAYLAGVCILLLRIGAGHWSLRRLARRAIVLDDPESIRLVRELSAMLPLRRSVRLLRDRKDSMPMTWGTYRPTILLPASSADWTHDRRRVVLLHELAHVARLDCITQLLGSITCALYWFHPGVWYVAARLRAEGELACDDRVLVAGAHPRSYAAHLLEVAHTIARPGGAPDVAVAMARPSQLEERMSAVLDGGRGRRGTSRHMVLAAGLAAGAFVAPVATVRPVAAYVVELRPESTAATGNRSSAAGASSFPGVQRLVEPDQVIERLIATRGGGRLVLDLATGADVKITGWDRDTVFAHAELRGRDWRSTRVEMLATPAGARIVMRDTSERRDYSTSHQLTIRVPRRYDVQIESMGGGIAIAQVRGTFAGRTNGGELRLTALAGDVHLHTNGGGITVTDSHLDGDVRTNGGNVEFRNVSGSLRGHTNGGRITRVTDSRSDQMDAASRSVGAAGETGFAFVTGEGESRRRAVAMLAQHAPPAAAVAALERLAREDGDPGVRAEAARQLNDLRRKMRANVQDSSRERIPPEPDTALARK